jgi:hypothetical protein
MVATRSFALPKAEAGSGVSGLPLLRSRDSRLSASNQNGAPRDIAMIVSSQPPRWWNGASVRLT